MLGFSALSERPLSALPNRNAVAFTGMVTYTATESDDLAINAASEPYVSFLADAVPGTPFDPNFDRLPRFERSIIGSTGFDGVSNSWGAFGLINTGQYDRYIRGVAFDAREVVFRAGAPGA